MSWFRLKTRTILIAVPIVAAVSCLTVWSWDFEAAMARASANARGRPRVWIDKSPLELASRALYEGRYQDAETWYRTSLAGPDRRFNLADDPHGRLSAQVGYARALEGVGRLEAAGRRLEAAVAEASGNLPATDRLLIVSQKQLDSLRGKSNPEKHPRETSRAAPPGP